MIESRLDFNLALEPRRCYLIASPWALDRRDLTGLAVHPPQDAGVGALAEGHRLEFVRDSRRHEVMLPLARDGSKVSDRANWHDHCSMPIKAATISTNGREIVIVAVRSEVRNDEVRRTATLDAFRSVFPNQQVVLAASTSAGIHVAADIPELAEEAQRHVRRSKPLPWQRYSFA